MRSELPAPIAANFNLQLGTHRSTLGSPTCFAASLADLVRVDGGGSAGHVKCWVGLGKSLKCIIPRVVVLNNHSVSEQFMTTRHSVTTYCCCSCDKIQVCTNVPGPSHIHTSFICDNMACLQSFQQICEVLKHHL